MIYVLGSIYNTISVELERFPKRGDEEDAETCCEGIGGKGALQAIAIAKLGARDDSDKSAVQLIAHVGKDPDGDALLSQLDSYRVGADFVRQVNRATGVCVNMQTAKDRRCVVYDGANSGISKTDVDEALSGASQADTLLCQLDVPLYIVMYALRKARALGMTTILNPAPAKQIPEEMYYNVDLIVPNDVEAKLLSGVTPNDFQAQKNAMRYFHTRGVQYVAISLGPYGVAFSDGSYFLGREPAKRVIVQDPSGAGECFVGALAFTYPHIGMYSFQEACRFANYAASIAISRSGVAESFPTLSEVCALYNRTVD